MIEDVLKQALEALETPRPLDDYPPILKAYAKTINEAITSLRQAIEQLDKQEPPCKTGTSCTGDCKQCAVEEPVAVVDNTITSHIDWLCTIFPKHGTKLYTHPQVIDKSAAIRIATALGWQPPKEEKNT